MKWRLPTSWSSALVRGGMEAGSRPPVPPAERLLNVNCGVLGHVDSGKTSLVKALSTNLSTASLDKHPQSRERGITLDLGFSSFLLPMPERMRAEDPGEAGKYDNIQLTLVDCPGHASLIRTIIGGAQIIDLVILVVDVVHGIQNQTAECLIIAEITTNDMIIVLNKIDMLPVQDRQERIQQQIKAIRQVLRNTKFASCPIVPMAAAVGGEKVAAVGPGTSGGGGGAPASVEVNGDDLTRGLEGLLLVKEGGGPAVYGLESLQVALRDLLRFPRRDDSGQLYFAFDHCFPIKGQGTVLTGTVLSGRVSIGDVVELPELGEQRKVKSIQMFHQSVRSARQGDRAALCVTNIDAKAVERGIVTKPGAVKPMTRLLAVVKKVRAFRTTAKSGSKFHISIGHLTVMAKASFFGAHELQGLSSSASSAKGPGRPSGQQQALHGVSVTHEQSMDVPHLSFDWSQDYRYQEALVGKDPAWEAAEGGKAGATGRPPMAVQFVLLELESPVLCPVGSLIIGSRLDVETSGVGVGSRIGFYGYVAEAVKEEDVKAVKIYKEKVREGSIYKLGEKKGVGASAGECVEEVTGQGLFKKETDLTVFMGMKVLTADGQLGVIDSAFGKTGKFRALFSKGLRGAQPGDKLFLKYVKYMHDPTRRMVQPASLLQPVLSPEQPAGTDGSALPVPPSAAQPPVNGAEPDSDDEGNGHLAKEQAAPPEQPPMEQRSGVVDNVKPGDLCIVKGLFSMEENIKLFVGMRVVAEEEGTEGCIVGPFGKGGKAKVQFNSTFTGSIGSKVTLFVPL